MSVKIKKRLELWDDILPLPRLSRTASIMLVTLLSAGCYVISVDGDFVFDDTEAVVHNRDVKLTNPVTEIFFNDFWGTRMNNNLSHKSYRPITVLSFRFNVWLNNGTLSSSQFRLTNILFHSIVSVLSINIFELLMGGNCSKAANLCAVIFSVHPVHTEAVAGVVGRAELLCAVFSFLSLMFYNKAAKTVKFINNLFYTLLSVILVLLAMFSKEQGITMLGICFFYDVLVVNKIYVENYLREFIKTLTMFNKNIETNVKGGNVINNKDTFMNKCHDANETRTKNNNRNIIIIYMVVLRFILLLIAGLLLLYVRWRVMSGVPPTFQKVDNRASFVDSFIFRIINYNYVYALNCWLLLCPVWLCFDWSMGCVPLIENYSDPRLVFVFMFWALLISLLFYPLFIYDDNKTHRSVLMALSFLIVSFLPASNLFFRVGFVIAERVLYLPSVGYCILLVIGVRQVLLNLPIFINGCSIRYQLVYYRITSIIFWLFVIAMYSGRSILRSYEWRNEYTLFKSALTICPLNAKVHYNMGKVTMNKTLSLNYYKQAIRLNPEYDQAMNNLANLLKDDGNLNEAEDLLRRSIKLRPNFAAAWMNLGIVLSNKKQYNDAEFAFLKAVEYRKHYPDCFYNLGNLYLDQKRFNEAETSWRKAVSQKPSHSIAWNNLIIMLDSMGKFKETESAAMEALYILPTDAGLHFNLANTLGKMSRYDEAEKHFKIAIGLNSNHALYYVNLGVLYHRWKKFESAKEMYGKALSINPKLESAERNLKMLL